MLLLPQVHMVFLDHLTANYASTSPVQPTAAGAPNYPLRADIIPGAGRWTVKMTSSTAPSLNLTLQGRLDSSGPWVSMHTITNADLTTTGQPANTYSYGRSVDLWPEMRCLVTTLSGTTPLLSVWISG